MNTDCKLIWESYELLTELTVSKANVRRLITKYGVDEAAARSLINRFNEVEGTLAKKDIFTYDSIEELEAAIGAVTTEREKVTNGAINVFENDKAIVLLIRTKEASIKHGRKAKWCVSYDDSGDQNQGQAGGNHFYTYINNDFTIYFVLPKTGIEKFAILKSKDGEYGEIKDKDNKDADIQKILSLYSLPERIFQSVPYTQQEKLIGLLSSPESALDYAKDVIGDRWPEGEPTIMKDPIYAVHYALEVIGDRWPEAEPSIIMHPYAAADYAQYVIGDRWPEAEPFIMMNPRIAYMYAHHVIEGRWPEAEPYIMRDTFTSGLYARDFLEGEWPEAEAQARKNSTQYDAYERGLAGDYRQAGDYP